jgi:hypothetical protein
MATPNDITQKVWHLELNPRNARMSKLTFAGEPVGLVKGIEFGVTAESAMPTIKFEVFLSNVHISMLPIEATPVPVVVPGPVADKSDKGAGLE